MPRLAHAVERLAMRRRAFLLWSSLLIAAIAIVDHLTGSTIGLGPFYLVPVTLGAWYLGGAVGMQLAVAATAAAFVADVAAFDGAAMLVLIWNTCARLVTFLFVAWVVSRMHGAFEKVNQIARTERDRAEELQEADEIKNTFLNAVSHELRTPLAAILGTARTLEDMHRLLDEDDLQVLLGGVVRNARKLDRLLRDLLDVDRLTRGVRVLDLAQTDLAKLVTNVVAEMELPAERPVHLRVASVVAAVDAPKVERIVENLLSNASKYSPPNSAIEISVGTDGTNAFITVMDAGPGIPLAERDRVFEPFWRRPADREVAGVGVGLSLVRSFAELHGGSVTIDDRPGGGACFVVSLPVHAETALVQPELAASLPGA
jgi:signal transduction histidine kinase